MQITGLVLRRQTITAFTPSCRPVSEDGEAVNLKVRFDYCFTLNVYVNAVTVKLPLSENSR